MIQLLPMLEKWLRFLKFLIYDNFVFGDLNTDLLNDNQDRTNNENLFTAFDIKVHIHEPTIVTVISERCIDH